MREKHAQEKKERERERERVEILEPAERSELIISGSRAD